MNNIEPRLITPQARSARAVIERKFGIKGSLFAIGSGITCGLYTAWVLVGTSRGVWADWYGENTAGLTPFVITFVIAILASGLNDAFSGIWTLIMCAFNGKSKDIGRTIKCKPFKLLIIAGILGGPFGATISIVALKMAGTITAAITALNPAIGTVLALLIFKQKVGSRKWCGIAICVIAAIAIGRTSFDLGSGALLGCIIAFIAAFFGAMEGVVGGYATTMIDYEIAIALRECTVGIINLFIIVPILCAFSGMDGLYSYVLSSAVFDPSIIFFVISGFFNVFAFSWWYKGNNMRGAAFGMAANGTFSFWVPLFSWLIVGLCFGASGYQLSAIQWIAAVVMAFGILVIAMNPLDLFRKRQEE